MLQVSPAAQAKTGPSDDKKQRHSYNERPSDHQNKWKRCLVLRVAIESYTLLIISGSQQQSKSLQNKNQKKKKKQQQ
jgi:hypothetical protein